MMMTMIMMMTLTYCSLDPVQARCSLFHRWSPHTEADHRIWWWWWFWSSHLVIIVILIIASGYVGYFDDGIDDCKDYRLHRCNASDHWWSWRVTMTILVKRHHHHHHHHHLHLNHYYHQNRWSRGRQSPSPHVNSSTLQLKLNFSPKNRENAQHDHLVKVRVVLRGSMEHPVSLFIVHEKLPKESERKEASE